MSKYKYEGYGVVRDTEIDFPYHTDDIVELLDEKDQQITDLEAKLAESEKQIKDAREAGNMAVDSWCKNRRKYEAQIAEMQNKSFILYSMLYETLEKQGCENVASQIDQMTGWTYDKEADWLKGNRNYDQLKQLAEKEKEIEYQENMKILAVDNQNKKAIEQLEKVLVLIHNAVNIDSPEYDLIGLYDAVSNQIKQLKGE